MADESFEPGGSPLYARLAREYADDPVVAEIARPSGSRWNLPMLVFAGVHLLELRGEEDDPWSRFGDVVRERREFLDALRGLAGRADERGAALVRARFRRSSPLRTSGRSISSSSARAPGLNLLWDRYRYRVRDRLVGRAGRACSTLTGDGRTRRPSCSTRRPVVRSRSASTARRSTSPRNDEALLLQSFVWADQPARLERLRRAIEVARLDPPRSCAATTARNCRGFSPIGLRTGSRLCSTPLSMAYLRRDERIQLAEEIEAAGRAGPLAWISYEFDEGSRPARVRGGRARRPVWPGGEQRRLARLDGHGNRMRWLA